MRYNQEIEYNICNYKFIYIYIQYIFPQIINTLNGDKQLQPSLHFGFPRLSVWYVIDINRTSTADVDDLHIWNQVQSHRRSWTDGEKEAPLSNSNQKNQWKSRIDLNHVFFDWGFEDGLYCCTVAFFRSADAVTFRAWNSDDIVKQKSSRVIRLVQQRVLSRPGNLGLLRLVWRVNVNLYAHKTMIWCYMMLFIVVLFINLLGLLSLSLTKDSSSLLHLGVWSSKTLLLILHQTTGSLPNTFQVQDFSHQQLAIAVLVLVLLVLVMFVLIVVHY